MCVCVNQCLEFNFNCAWLLYLWSWLPGCVLLCGFPPRPYLSILAFFSFHSFFLPSCFVYFVSGRWMVCLVCLAPSSPSAFHPYFVTAFLLVNTLSSVHLIDNSGMTTMVNRVHRQTHYILVIISLNKPEMTSVYNMVNSLTLSGPTGFPRGFENWDKGRCRS